MKADRLGVVHYGLGPIGMAVGRVIAGRPWLRSVGAVDVRPELVGRDLGEVLDLPSGGVGVRIVDNLGAAAVSAASVVVHCTGSSLRAGAPQLYVCIDAGLNVVSTCEELAYPWAADPETAAAIDRRARERGVTVLGTGVNPGFVMDYLPVVLSAVTREVERVEVIRVQEAGNRRLPLQQKVGAGLTREEFEEGVRVGSIRHVGLRESADAVAAALGWRLTRIDRTIRPLIAKRETPSGLGLIPAGHVVGVHQTLSGRVGQIERVSLALQMGVGLADPHDDIVLHGTPTLRVRVEGGVPGDIATAAIVANALGRVVAAAPGLAVMTDLAPPLPAAPGRQMSQSALS